SSSPRRKRRPVPDDASKGPGATPGLTFRGEGDMASTTHMPPPGGGALGAVDRFVARIEHLFYFVAALVIFMLMFFMVAEVLGRKLLNNPIPGAIDWIEVSMATFAFMGAAYCQRLGGHIRMELVISRLHGRLLWAIEAITTGLA